MGMARRIRETSLRARKEVVRLRIVRDNGLERETGGWED